MFKMYWWTIVAILLVAPFFESSLAQRPSDIEENKKIEAKHNCKCVKEYLCDDSNKVDVYGDNIIGTRIRSPIIPCKGAYANEMLCCKLNDTVATDKGPDYDIRPSTNTTCGTMKTHIIPRIFTKGDELDAIDGDFPWIVAIFDRNSQFRCGGTLIHPKVVLTANHCVYGKRPNFFAVGANGRIDIPKDETSKKYVAEIISHPRYAHTGRLYNDAALLILETPFVDENLNTLCLPPQNFDLEGKRCIVAGWGQDNNGQRREKLKKVEVPFVNHSQCDTLMRNSRLGRNFRLHSSFMCAGGEEGNDACIGDGGGALLCETSADPQQFSQKGIVSWGIGCGLKNVPGVYTDVEKISNWIKDELLARNLKI